jgi:2-polyprenyl-3-methyl-5-hydroxy-6-metoxy-1,4-benzoquinol methylase
MNKDLLYEKNQVFGDFYNEWRLKRILKLELIFGTDWFNGKEILELACGYGHIGLYLESLGAKVTFSDSRKEHLDEVLKKNPNANVVCINQNEDWNLNKKFDLVIHFGVLYHIENWKKDLEISIKHGKFIALETAVNIYKNEVQICIENASFECQQYGSIEKKLIFVSTKLIENVIKENKTSAKRYDDDKLNCNNQFVYNIKCNKMFDETCQKITTTDIKNITCRKFWIIENNQENIL